MPIAPIPVYRLNPSLVFPEVPPYVDSKGNPLVQSTADNPDAVAAVTLAMAYLLGGGKFTGALQNLTDEQIYKEVNEFCLNRQLNVERLFDWAESILLPPEATLTPEEMLQVPTFIEGVNFSLDDYQRDVAAWNARRLGSIQALGCGVGKSATATAAAITAARIGRCSAERCFIVCPVNAMPQWQAYLIDLRKTFQSVDVISVDSLHLIQGIERETGGALIIDEIHKLKGYGAQRTTEAHNIRPAFQWCVCLTGTLLHSGPEGVLSMQDLACPGLSRYTDKWALGSAFNCIVLKSFMAHGSKKQRRSLVYPSGEAKDRFDKYLARGVRSLRFESEEVKKVFQIPANTRIRVSNFPQSDWFKQFEIPDVTEIKDFEKLMEKNYEILNPSNLKTKLMVPAIALATMIEDREQWVERMAFMSAGEKMLLTPEEKEYPGMPTFSGIVHRVSKLGWEDLLLQRCTFFADRNESVPAVGYRFIRPPGATPNNPMPGPKIRWLEQWLKDNKQEPVVIGAAAVNTINMVQSLLIEMGTPYRLIRGGATKQHRTSAVADFQKGLYGVMLLQQVAGSESVTLTKSRFSMLLDHDWQPVSYTQFVHRTYRRGQTRETVHYDLIHNWMQEAIVDRLQRGEAFDARVREQLEQEAEYSKIKSDFGIAKS